MSSAPVLAKLNRAGEGELPLLGDARREVASASEGGALLIGVDDEGDVVGLAPDMKTLGSKSNRDGYELLLRQSLDNNLSIQTAGIVRIRFEHLNGSDVCVVSVALWRGLVDEEMRS